MKRPLLFAYQLLTGDSDGGTGALLLVAPALTLRLMRLHAPQDALPFVSFVGAFVLSTGFACLYGAALTQRPELSVKLETVWLLTSFTRTLVAIYVLAAIVTGTLEHGWATVAVSDGAIALLQVVGLWRGWLTHAAN